MSLASPGRARRRASTPPNGSPRSTPAEPDVCDAGKIAKLEVEAGAAFSVSRSSSRRPRRVSDPAGFDGPGWLDARTSTWRASTCPPGAERGAPTLERISHADAVPRLARARVPGRPHHRHERQDHDGRACSPSCSTRSGLQVGAYTSPHLERVNERMSIDGEPIDDDALDEHAATRSRSSSSRSGVDPSYFDIVTAAAFRWFADEAVDVAVVEVGLGGTWDATNVVDGRVAVVTNVSVDHVEYLGPTPRADRAGEGRHREARRDARARRDRPRAPGRSSTAAARRRACCGATSTSACRATCSRSAAGSSISRSPGAEYPDVFLPLHGAHQADNAAIALAAAESFVGAPLAVRRRRRRVRARAVARAGSRSSAAIRSCCSTARTTSPAREALRAALDEEFSAGAAHARRRVAAREGAARDAGRARRSTTSTHARVLPAAEPARSTRSSSPRPPIDLGLPEERIEVVDTSPRRVSSARCSRRPTDGQIVITGSLYVVGAARVGARRSLTRRLTAVGEFRPRP